MYNLYELMKFLFFLKKKDVETCISSNMEREDNPFVYVFCFLSKIKIPFGSCF